MRKERFSRKAMNVGNLVELFFTVAGLWIVLLIIAIVLREFKKEEKNEGL